MQQRSLQTRAEILEAAGKLFSIHGYDGTGVAEICAEAGLSKGAFYHHFESKQAVFLALLENWISALDENFQQSVSSPASVPEKLFSMASTTGSLFTLASEHFPLIMEFWIQASRQPEIWKAAVAPYHHYQAYFSNLIQQGIDEESLEIDTDPEVAARVTLAMVMGLLLQACFDPGGAEWNRMTQEGLHMLTRTWERRKV